MEHAPGHLIANPGSTARQADVEIIKEWEISALISMNAAELAHAYLTTPKVTGVFAYPSSRLRTVKGFSIKLGIT